MSLVLVSAVAFGVGLYRGASKDVGTEFFAALVLEVAMSAENLFAIYLVFRYFRVPPALQEHVLWWGFGLSALLRGAVIVSGGLFIAAQKEAILLFAGVVIYSGYRLAIHGAAEDMVEGARGNVEGNKVISAIQSVVPVSDYYDGVKFVTTNPLDGASKLTPLFLVLLIIEATDLMFALDNVPALYSIVPSGNVLVVYAATLFGIAMLRAAYALVAVSLPHAVHLQRTTGAALILIGARSVADYFEKGHVFPPAPFLGVLVVILVGGMFASCWDVGGLGADGMAPEGGITVGPGVSATQGLELGAVRQHMDPLAEANRVAVSQGAAGGFGGANGAGAAWVPGQAERTEAAAPLLRFDDVDWGGRSDGGLSARAAPSGGGDLGRPRVGNTIASNMINDVMNIDGDFPPRPDRNAGLSAGVQPLPAAFKMTAQD